MPDSDFSRRVPPGQLLAGLYSPFIFVTTPVLEDYFTVVQFAHYPYERQRLSKRFFTLRHRLLPGRFVFTIAGIAAIHTASQNDNYSPYGN